MAARRRVTSLQKLKAWLVAATVAPLTAIGVRLCPVRMLRGEEHIEPILEEKRPAILCTWHDRLAYLPLFMGKRLQRAGITSHALISRSRDGEIMARLARWFGYQVVRGSTSRGGAASLRELTRRLRRGGVVATVGDGPRGPRHVFKPGPVALAKLSGAPIVPIAYAAGSAWTLDTWDRFILPKPFSRVAVVIGKPMSVARDASDSEVETLLVELQQRMQAALDEAESLVGVLSSDGH